MARAGGDIAFAEGRRKNDDSSSRRPVFGRRIVCGFLIRGCRGWSWFVGGDPR
jgi:hypothetical protein